MEGIKQFLSSHKGLIISVMLAMTATVGCFSLVYSKIRIRNDNFIEDIIEDEIEHPNGNKIDLTIDTKVRHSETKLKFPAFDPKIQQKPLDFEKNPPKTERKMQNSSKKPSEKR